MRVFILLCFFLSARAQAGYFASGSLECHSPSGEFALREVLDRWDTTMSVTVLGQELGSLPLCISDEKAALCEGDAGGLKGAGDPQWQYSFRMGAKHVLFSATCESVPCLRSVGTVQLLSEFGISEEPLECVYSP